MLSAAGIADLVEKPKDDDPVVIRPRPNCDELRKSGAASVDLRLGTWFCALRESRIGVLDVRDTSAPIGPHMVRKKFVPFGDAYILHPGSFVLAATLEWIR